MTRKLMTSSLKSLLAFVAVLLMTTGLSRAQVQLGGHVFVPSTTDSTLGQTSVVFTSDANCTVATATNCTVSGGVSGPYTGTLVVTGTISAARSVVVPLSPGRSYTVENKTIGGQAITVIGATGNGVAVPNGQTATVNSDGTNYFTALGGVLTSTLYGGDVCWHYELGNTPLTACLRYAGHGNYYGVYVTNDGTTFTAAPFSVGQLNVGQAGATGANGQAQAPSVYFYEGDTGTTGPVQPVIGTIAMYQAQPTGACPNAGVPGAEPVWGFAPDSTISFCTNAGASTWALFSSGGGGIGGLTAGYYTVATGPASVGNGTIDFGKTSANTLTVTAPANDTVSISSSGTGGTSVIGGSAGESLGSSAGPVSIVAGTSVNVVTGGVANFMSFPNPGITGTVGVLEGSVGHSQLVESDSSGIGLQTTVNIPSGTGYTNLAPASTAFFGIISAGDSRFAGQNAQITSTQNFIAQLNTQPQFAGRTTFAINGAVAGSTCATMTSNYASHVQPYKPSSQGGVQVFQYIMEGINDIRTSVSFSSWSSCYYTYLQTITADGFTPIIATTYYDASVPAGTGSAPNDLLRFQWNQFIRSLQGQVINGQTIHVFDADAAVGVSTNLVYGTSVYDSPQANYAITGYSVSSGIGTFTTSAASPPAASTTATFTSGSASITVASATGIVLGQYITATGIPAGDYVASIAGTTIGLAPSGTTAIGTATAAIFNSPVLLSGFPSTSACLNASQTATVTYVSATQFTMPVSCPNVSSSTDTGLAQAMYFDGLHLNPQSVATILAPAANRDFALYNSGTPVTATPPDRTDVINPISGTLNVLGNIVATGTVSPANLTASAPLQSTTSAANGSFIKSTGSTAKLDISGSSTTAFVEFPTGSFWQMGNCFSADFTICNGTSNLKPFDISTTAPTQSLWILGSGAAQSIAGFQSTTLTAATSSVNNNSPANTSTATYWNGAASANDTWSWVDVLGTGTNPTSTYTLTSSGSSGAHSVSIPNATLTGTPTAPTATPGTSTTQVSTTAYNQASFAAPPAIGNTTPNTVAASTIKSTATGTSASTAPICPNGTGGTFTTSGCATGSVTPTTQVINCSTSGTLTFAETIINSFDHKVAVMNPTVGTCVGTATYTYATAFSTPPGIFKVVGATNTTPYMNFTSTTTQVTVTGGTASEYGYLEGW